MMLAKKIAHANGRFVSPLSACIVVCTLTIILFAFVPQSFAADLRLADVPEKSDRPTLRTLLNRHAAVNELVCSFYRPKPKEIKIADEAVR